MVGNNQHPSIHTLRPPRRCLAVGRSTTACAYTNALHIHGAMPTRCLPPPKTQVTPPPQLTLLRLNMDRLDAPSAPMALGTCSSWRSRASRSPTPITLGWGRIEGGPGAMAGGGEHEGGVKGVRRGAGGCVQCFGGAKTARHRPMIGEGLWVPTAGCSLIQNTRLYSHAGVF